MNIDLTTCAVTGDVNGACGQTFDTSGNTESERAHIWFRFDVQDPAATESATIRCLHDPVWPLVGRTTNGQIAETVHITAEALAADLKPMAANALEIYVSNDPFGQSGYTRRTVGVGTAITDSFDATATFAYHCRAVFGNQAVSTGWRVVTVGQDLTRAIVVGGGGFGSPSWDDIPYVQQWVAIAYTGPSIIDAQTPAEEPSRLDIVFVADHDAYIGSDETGHSMPAADPEFLRDVYDAIRVGLFSAGSSFPFTYYIANQDKLNLWIAADPGFVSFSGDDRMTCDSEVLEAPWADVNLLLFRDPIPASGTYEGFRDCKSGHTATTGIPVTSSGNRITYSAMRTMRHELAHALFGLADEYPRRAAEMCGEDPNDREFTHGDGGYFENYHYPNLWSDEGRCKDAMAGLGLDPAAGCRSFIQDVSWWFDDTWYTSDPGLPPEPFTCVGDPPSPSGPIDLMVDNTIPRAADVARMDWVIRMCSSGACGAGQEHGECWTDLQCGPGLECRNVIDDTGAEAKVCTRADLF